MAFYATGIIIRGDGDKNQGGAAMDELEKLRHLIVHWAEHNEEHADSYLQWADKASVMGRPLLEAALRELAGEARRLDPLFQAAIKECAD